MISSSRRRFLSSVLAAGAVAPLARAVAPFERPGKPSFRLGLAAYSFRQALQDGSDFDLFQFIDYCANLGLEGTELTSYYFPSDADEEYLLKIRRHAFLRGIAISGTAVGNNFALPRGEKRDQEIAGVKKWVDRAVAFGAPHIRVFAGAAGGLEEDDAFTLCIEALEETAEYAGQHGIFLGLENHGGLVAEASGMLRILEAVESPWLGVNLDTGNFHTEDPYGDLAKCAPFAVNVQVKVEMRPRNGNREPVDLKRLVRLLRDANYQGFIILEYEAAEDPFEAVPAWLERLAEVFQA